MSRQPPQPPPPPFFPEAFAHNRSTNARQNVTVDSAYVQGRPAYGHVDPPQMPSPSGYPSQQYSSSQLSPPTSRRSTLPTTSSYDHASLPPHQSAPPPLSGSTSYNPSFPVPTRYPDTNPSGPPPPAPILHRSSTMPMPIHPNPASSVPYDMRPPNTMHSPPQSGIQGGPQSTAQGFSYLDVHDRGDDSSNFSDEDFEHRREHTRHSGEYVRDRSPPNRSSAGRQPSGHGGSNRQYKPPPPELLRCMTCGRVCTRAEAEYRRWFCVGGHMGQWRQHV